jgi:hypothetical protein
VYVPRILRARRISTGNSLNEHVSLTIPQRIPFRIVSPTRCGQSQASTAARPIFPLAHSKAKQIGPQTARISNITQPLAALCYTRDPGFGLARGRPRDLIDDVWDCHSSRRLSAPKIWGQMLSAFASSRQMGDLHARGRFSKQRDWQREIIARHVDCYYWSACRKRGKGRPISCTRCISLSVAALAWLLGMPIFPTASASVCVRVVLTK